ncbi:MAG TPA: DUF996 domain-containing protein [Persephonella sp.]|nr:DUF996 domain-containing protein [Persephonella sp.]
MEIKNIKLLGGIGISLSLFSWFPIFGILSLLVGSISTFIAFWKISKIKPEEKIFKNAILGWFFAFLGGFFIVLTSIMTASNNLGYMLLPWTIMAIFLGISGNFYKKALYSISKVFKEKLFKTAGDVIFFGSLGTIVLIGFFVIFIGWFVAAIAFFKLPDEIDIHLES